MAVLSPTEISGRTVFLGTVKSRGDSPVSTPDADFVLSFRGIEGESHSGMTRASCARVTGQYARGTQIRNVRQVSIVSVEDLRAIARGLGVAAVEPEWLGANIVVEGIPDFTLVPPSSRLIFAGGVSLTVDMENAPCTIPAREIERHHPGAGTRFRAAARNLRGVTAWVEREGTIRLGETMRLHVPPQRLYPPLVAREIANAEG
jgi:hypothetical protein